MIGLRRLVTVLALTVSATAGAELKTYDVPPQLQQEIYAALERILNASGPGIVQGGSYGRVQLLPSGQIIVNAPPETLEQVDQVLAAIRTRPAAAVPRADLYYWAVLGSRAAASDPPGTPPPSSLNDVLDELRRLHGDLQFRVIGSASLATESGIPGSVSGTALEVDQSAYVQGETLNASIRMRLQGRQRAEAPGPEQFDIGSIHVQTALRRGEFVVLGQSEVGVGGLDGPVFFIVHWPEAGRR
jgi:hypothetical protein